MSSRLPPVGGSALLGLAFLSCARPAAPVARPSPGGPGAEDRCALAANPGPPPDTLSVALAGAVDAGHAPVARNAAERFVFRQLYETLIRLDCTGEPRPGLASSWSATEGGRVWDFTLRPDARFWDGAPVRAADVVAAWGGPAAERGLLPAGMSVSAPGAGTLRVNLASAARTVPHVLADPAWAVTRVAAGDPWPMGTGRFRADTGGGRVMLVAAGAEPVVELRSRVAGDMRDLLDAGVDILVTAEPAALGYAAQRPDLTTEPLPWDSTYVLLTQAEVAVFDSLRPGLARDAVRVDARPAAGPFWWMDRGERMCAVSSREIIPPVPPSAPLSPVRTVWAALEGDGPARDLSERLVALMSGRMGTDGAARALTMAPDTFAAALWGGRFAGYVLAVPRRPPDACRALRDLVRRAPWLARAVLVPLVDTRRHVVIRRGAAAFTVDWDGTLRLR